MRRSRSRPALVLAFSAALLAVTPVTGTLALAEEPGHGTISTLAGNGSASGPIGDGGPATQASVDAPTGVAKDAAGNTYIAEYGRSRVRKVSPQGVITTFAGTGVYGSGPDGGPAVSTPLKTPAGVAVDKHGNVYIADYLDSKVRKVGTDGIITTFAGNGQYGFAGDGGPASTATLNGPFGVSAGVSGKVFIADTDNNRIRVVGTDGVITTIAGTGVVGTAWDQLDHPRGVAAAPNDEFVVADTENSRIFRYSRVSDGRWYPDRKNLGGHGSGWAQVDHPTGVAVDAAYNVYVADTRNNRVGVVNARNRSRPFAGTNEPGYSGDGGAATVAKLNAPAAVAVDATGNVIVADQDNNRVRSVTPSPFITTIAGNGTWGEDTGDGGPAVAARLAATGVGVDRFGNVYISSSYNRIRKVNPQGVISTFATQGENLLSPAGLATDQAGNIYVGNRSLNTVVRYDPNGRATVVAGARNVHGGFSGDGGPATAARLHDPFDTAVDSAGNIYILDQVNLRIRKVDTNGIITTIAGNGTKGYSGDSGPATAAQLTLGVGSGGIAVDSSGNVYFTDNLRIRKVAPNGIITTFAGSGEGSSYDDQVVGAKAVDAPLMALGDVTTDAAGNVYLLGKNRVLKIGADGIIRSLAGAGLFRADPWSSDSGCVGDGGLAVLAELAGYGQLAVDQAGNIFVMGCGRIRKINAS